MLSQLADQKPASSSSGTENDERCIRQCEGERKSKSDGSSVRAVKGLEFRHASIWHIRVASFESERT